MKLAAPAFVWNKIGLTAVIVKSFPTTMLLHLIA
jgi:hypothetical protein